MECVLWTKKLSLVFAGHYSQVPGDLDLQLGSTDQSRKLKCFDSFPDPNRFKQIATAAEHWIHCWELAPLLVPTSPEVATSSWLSPTQLLVNVMCTWKKLTKTNRLHDSRNYRVHSESRQDDPSTPKAHYIEFKPTVTVWYPALNSSFMFIFARISTFSLHW